MIGAVEEGFRALGRGDVRAPERLHLDIPESGAVMLEMPAYARSLIADRPGRQGFGSQRSWNQDRLSVQPKCRARPG